MAQQSTENATIFQGLQLGVETTPGTAVSANKRLPCTNLEGLSTEIPSEDFTPTGQKIAEDVVLGKGLSRANIAPSPMSPNDMAYLWASYFDGAPDISTPGGGTLSRDWVFVPRYNSPDTLQTFTLDQGSFVQAARADYGIVNSLKMRVDAGSVMSEVSGTILAQLLTMEGIYPTGYEVHTFTPTGTVSGGTFTITVDGDTTAAIAYNATAQAVADAVATARGYSAGDVIGTGGPQNSAAVVLVYVRDYGSAVGAPTVDDALITGGGTIEEVRTQTGVAVTTLAKVPLGYKDFSVYMANAIGDLPADFTVGASAGEKLTRCNMVDADFPERNIAGMYVDNEETSFSALIEQGIGAKITIGHQLNSTGAGFFEDFKDGQKKYLRVCGRGPLIEGSLYYGIQFTVCGKISNFTPGDANGVYNGTMDFTIIRDSDMTLDSWFEGKLRNTLTAL